MSLLYYTGIRLYHLMVFLASLFNEKAREFIRGRKGLFSHLEENTAGWDQTVWFHCASLGEFEQGRPLIEEMKARDPGLKILLTFFSPSGYRIRKDYSHADYVTYLPVDTPSNARRLVELLQPEKVFFIKYEYWYFLLRELHGQDIPVFLVSAIFRKEQVFFRWYGGWFRKMLHDYRQIFVQDDASRQLLLQYGITHVAVSGDTRFDRVRKISRNATTLPLIEKFRGDELLVIGGSTWPGDEELLIRYYKESGHSFKMILAPHEVYEQNIQRLSAAFDTREVVIWSGAHVENIPQARVLIIDVVGLLSALYGYGNLAFIGGGFGKGIHNILEAATHGLPVIFGPNHQKFKEALDLKSREAAFSVSNFSEFRELMDSLFADRRQIRTSGKTARFYVEENAGATTRILNFLTVRVINS